MRAASRGRKPGERGMDTGHAFSVQRVGSYRLCSQVTRESNQCERKKDRRGADLTTDAPSAVTSLLSVQAPTRLRPAQLCSAVLSTPSWPPLLQHGLAWIALAIRRHLPNSREQIQLPERLGAVVVHTARQTPLFVSLHCVCCESDDWRTR